MLIHLYCLLILSLLHIIHWLIQEELIYQIVIGKIFSATKLGFYTQAHHFSSLISINLNGIIGRVTYPVLSSIQNEDERLSNNYRKLLRLSAFAVFPVMCLLAGVSHPFIILLLGEKWLFSATLIIPICFSTMWYPIHALNLNLLNVKGRSDLFLKLEIIKKVIGVLILAFSVPFGLVFMCWMSVVSSLIALVINTYYTGKLIHVGGWIQIKDLFPTLLLSLTVFAVSYCICLLFENNIVKLSLSIVVSIVIYFSTSYLFKFEELQLIKSIRKK